MKCSKCHKRNMKKANFCTRCGNKFTKKEKENAKDGLLGFLKGFKLFRDVVTFDFIKGNPIVQFFLVLLVLLVGIYTVLTMGYKLRIMESPEYEVKYNSKEEEYYIFINEEIKDVDKIRASLYIPNRVKGLKLEYYDENDNVINVSNHERKDEITLDINTTENNYYLLSDTNDKEDVIKILVFYKGKVEIK